MGHNRRASQANQMTGLRDISDIGILAFAMQHLFAHAANYLLRWGSKHRSGHIWPYSELDLSLFEPGDFWDYRFG